MSSNTQLAYYQKIGDMILNKAKDFYKNNKDKIKEQGKDKHNIAEEELKK